MINPETFATAARVLSAALPVLSLKRDKAWKEYCTAKPRTSALYAAAIKADEELKNARAEYVHALHRAAGRAVK